MEKNKTYHNNQRQIVKHDGDRYQIKDGKHVDEVVLRFDEAEQKFYARIVNPSQHTQYLCAQGKLGLTLSKLNTGAAVVTADHSCRLFVPNHYRPRWRRCCDNWVEVLDLDTEIEIDPDIQGLKPPKVHSYSNNYYNFYTKIKCTLMHLTGNREAKAFRCYKTYSNLVAIKVEDGETIRIRATGGHKVNPPYPRKYTYGALQCQQISNNRYEVTIVNPNAALQQAIESGHVYVGLEHDVKGKYVTGAVKHLHYGDTEYEYPFTPNPGMLRRNHRWQYRINATYMVSDYRLMEQSSMTYTMPVSVTSHQISRLYHLIHKHGTESADLYIDAPNLVIMIKGASASTIGFGRIGACHIAREYAGFIDCLGEEDLDPTLVNNL